MMRCLLTYLFPARYIYAQSTESVSIRTLSKRQLVMVVVVVGWLLNVNYQSSRSETVKS